MSQERNLTWLNNRKVIYQRNPITDTPTESNDVYDYYSEGTHQCYTLFSSRAKITTYKSLKWHFLVLYYLNEEGIENDYISLDDDMRAIFKFIANKENGFVTFFIKHKLLDSMINDVIEQGGDPPKNRIRKVIFKPYTGLSIKDKLSIVGSLIGRSKRITEEKIYLAMLDINDSGVKITMQYLANLLDCSSRTIHRNISKELKQEKTILNEKI
jgi:hypothetical protein